MKINPEFNSIKKPKEDLGRDLIKEYSRKIKLLIGESSNEKKIEEYLQKINDEEKFASREDIEKVVTKINESIDYFRESLK